MTPREVKFTISGVQLKIIIINKQENMIYNQKKNQCIDCDWKAHILESAAKVIETL